MNTFTNPYPLSEIFIKAADLKNLKLNTAKINLACTFLLKVKDKNYMELRNVKSNSAYPYSVIVYENNNKENAQFKTRTEAKHFMETLNFVNDMSNV